MTAPVRTENWGSPAPQTHTCRAEFEVRPRQTLLRLREPALVHGPAMRADGPVTPTHAFQELVARHLVGDSLDQLESTAFPRPNPARRTVTLVTSPVPRVRRLSTAGARAPRFRTGPGAKLPIRLCARPDLGRRLDSLPDLPERHRGGDRLRPLRGAVRERPAVHDQSRVRRRRLPSLRHARRRRPWPRGCGRPRVAADRAASDPGPDLGAATPHCVSVAGEASVRLSPRPQGFPHLWTNPTRVSRTRGASNRTSVERTQPRVVRSWDPGRRWAP